MEGDVSECPALSVDAIFVDAVSRRGELAGTPFKRSMLSMDVADPPVSA
jgi:hypothetical protein